ncbi:MAG: amidophosphoribosyltransferase [Clostridiales bacterium]|nr:amidophosphoribosyltransferase [Clostridiales bacterium]
MTAMNDIGFGKLKEECGVFGIFNKDHHDVARLTYQGLYALQHRGQESAGIAVNDEGRILQHKDMGLVQEVFDEVVLNHLKGRIAIGHVRYSTTGASLRENAQPMVVKYRSGQMALAHNGNLVNAAEIRMRMEDAGAIFQSTSDTEVIANLISRNRINSENIEDTLAAMMKEVKGSYALVLVTPKRLIGIRDPLGIRPLCIGKVGESYVLASESCALDAVGADFVRDVMPGEIVLIGEEGIESVQTEVPGKPRLCIFEFVYFARPDSVIDGYSVHRARVEAGRRLAIEHPVDADIVIGAPDGGLNAALGYSRESGIPYGQGLLKNRYVGRTFIQPEQGQREAGVRTKFNAMKSEIAGKRVIMVDDSIVRGTTTRRIVQMLKDAGAKEVHMRVSSPPYKFPCYFGIDISSSKQLVASKYSIDEIKDIIGADSLGYLSLEGLLQLPMKFDYAGGEIGSTEKQGRIQPDSSCCKTASECGFCTACFNSEYPMEVPEEGYKFSCDSQQ